VSTADPVVVWAASAERQAERRPQRPPYPRRGRPSTS